MDIVSKGAKTFIQTYNPKVIAVVEARNDKKVVYRFYSSINVMPAADRVAYCAASRLENTKRRAYGA